MKRKYHQVLPASWTRQTVSAIIRSDAPGGKGQSVHFRPQYDRRDLALTCAWLNGDEVPLQTMNLSDYPGHPARHGDRYRI